VAKAVNNDKAQPGKGTSTGKTTQAGKGVSKRPDAKPARSAASKSASKARAASKSGDKRSIGKFFRDVRVELRKVTWPTRKELVQSTVVVLVAVGIATLYTFVLDTAFSRLIDLVLTVIT
jgi:preprotein translocase subunit SecE